MTIMKLKKQAENNTDRSSSWGAKNARPLKFVSDCSSALTHDFHPSIHDFLIKLIR